jgi:hypothetical protein
MHFHFQFCREFFATTFWLLIAQKISLPSQGEPVDIEATSGSQILGDG